MEIEIRYRLGKGPYIVGGTIDDLPFEVAYLNGDAKIVIITDDYVSTTHGKYAPGLGELDSKMTGQLIFNLARKLTDEFENGD